MKTASVFIGAVLVQGSYERSNADAEMRKCRNGKCPAALLDGFTAPLLRKQESSF